MWRQHQYEEDWERRKAYLIRSLFQDVPSLSPVPEEEESNDSRPSPSPALPTSTVIREPLERPCSPLPPLIIEKEQNKHDEPPEFYRKLEKRIMKFYRRLFIEDLSGISNVSDSTDTSPLVAKYCKSDRRASFRENNSDDIESAIDEAIKINQSRNWNSRAGGLIESNEENEKDQEEEISSSTDILPRSSTDDEETEKRVSNNDSPKSTSDSTKTYIIGKQSSPVTVTIVPVDEETSIMKQDKSSNTDILPKSTTSEIYEENIRSYDLQPANKDTSDTDNKIETMETSSSTTDIDYRQVTFKADVHRDATEKVALTTPSLIYELNVREGSMHRDDIHDNNIRIAELEENYVSDIGDHNNSDYDNDNTEPIEVMRTPNMYKSDGSLHNKLSNDASQCYDNDIGEISRSIEAHTEYDSSKESPQNKIDFEVSIDFDILRASVVNRENDFGENNDPKDVSSCKRKCSTPRSSPTPSKRMKYKDVCFQVNCEEDELNKRILVDNVFVGVPRVFRLCYCANHLCG